MIGNGLVFSIFLSFEKKKQFLLNLFFQQERHQHLPQRTKYTESELLEEIVADNIFGVAECDVSVPDDLKHKFSQFPPVFKNVNVSINDVGPYMKELCQKSGYLSTPRRTLISSFFGEEVVLTTDQIKWYLQNGECNEFIT